MKKVLIGMLVVAVAVGFAIRAYSAEVKDTVKSSEGKTVEKTEVKAGDVKAKSETTTTAEGSMTKEEVKGKNIKVKKEEAQTTTPVAEGGAAAGKTKVDVKKGAITDMKVEWVYYRQGPEYVIEYNVKEKNNKKLMSELNLTPEQAQAIQAGSHKIVSTSPYTADDVKGDFRAVILKDLANSIAKK